VGSTRPKTLSLLYCLYYTAGTTGCNNIMLTYFLQLTTLNNIIHLEWGATMLNNIVNIREQ
jgi:hypothetical protein